MNSSLSVPTWKTHFSSHRGHFGRLKILLVSTWRVRGGRNMGTGEGEQASGLRLVGKAHPGDSPPAVHWVPPGGTLRSRRRRPGSGSRGSEPGSCAGPRPSSAAPAPPWAGGHAGRVEGAAPTPCSHSGS